MKNGAARGCDRLLKAWEITASAPGVLAGRKRKKKRNEGRAGGVDVWRSHRARQILQIIEYKYNVP